MYYYQINFHQLQLQIMPLYKEHMFCHYMRKWGDNMNKITDKIISHWCKFCIPELGSSLSNKNFRKNKRYQGYSVCSRRWCYKTTWNHFGQINTCKKIQYPDRGIYFGCREEMHNILRILLISIVLGVIEPCLVFCPKLIFVYHWPICRNYHSVWALSYP